MQNLLNWAAENERLAANFYSLAARRFRKDPAISHFLEELSHDEEDHFQELVQLAQHSPDDPAPFALEPGPLLEQEIRSRLRQANDDLLSGCMTEADLWRQIIQFEFAENNALFLHISACLPATASEDRPRSLIDRHLERIEAFLKHRYEAWGAATDLQQLRPAWPKRILVVEGDPHVRQLVSLALHRLAWVTPTADGAGAVQALQQSRFDAVVLDLDLGPSESAAILSHIHQQHPSLAHRVILCGKNDALPTDDTSEHRFLQLAKPLRLSRLSQAVETLLLSK